MRPFLLRRAGEVLGEGVEFSDGTVVVRWLQVDSMSRFVDVDALREAVPEGALEPIRPAPLADRLRDARMSEGMSQRALAREVGVSFSTISRIERGANHVMHPKLEAWLNGR